MTVTETNYVWYLVGDVALIYAATLALKWIGDKVWWWYVGKVLGSLGPSATGDHPNGLELDVSYPHWSITGEWVLA